MNERWVCKRCYADNNETDAACQRCGLIRGADATPADQTAWASQGSAVATAPDPGWRRWIRFWWIPVLAIVLVAGYLGSARRDDSGAITAGGDLSIEDVTVGDCFDSDDSEEIASVEARRCDEPHEFEMFHVATWTGPDTYPTDDEMINFVVEECMPVFGSYVGLPYEASRLDFMHTYPVEEGWDDGDRIFQCALFDPADPELIQSMRDSAL
ncbi:MAG: hypothetical protein QOI85_1563 [Chloroflexota bacterium]|nr:hypothetical protein [Chloroflexota bacterium]